MQPLTFEEVCDVLDEHTIDPERNRRQARMRGARDTATADGVCWRYVGAAMAGQWLRRGPARLD
jgi:hypothetical protein